MEEKLGTFEGDWDSATGPFVKLKKEKFPAEPLSVNSIHKRYVPSATAVPFESVPFQLPYIVP